MKKLLWYFTPILSYFAVAGVQLWLVLRADKVAVLPTFVFVAMLGAAYGFLIWRDGLPPMAPQAGNDAARGGT